MSDGTLTLEGARSSSGKNDNSVELDVVNSGIKVELAALAGERNIATSNQYFASVPEWNYTLITFTAEDNDTIISSNPVLFKAIIEISTLTGDITVRDGTTAAGVSLGVHSADKDFHGIKLNTGLFIDDNASAGAILVIWRDQ